MIDVDQLVKVSPLFEELNEDAFQRTEILQELKFKMSQKQFQIEKTRNENFFSKCCMKKSDDYNESQMKPLNQLGNQKLSEDLE